MAVKRGPNIPITATNKTDRAFKAVKGNLSGLEKMAFSTKAAFSGIVGVAAIAGIVTLGKKALDTADALGKASERTGFTVEKLQELRFAGDQTGLSIGGVDNALAKFTKRLGLMRTQGKGAAAGIYKQLGLDLNQSNLQIFDQVVDKIANTKSHTDRLALSTELFGEDAQRMELMLRGGTAGLKAFADEAKELGLILDESLVRGAEQANDEMSKMSQVLNIQVTRTLIELAPTITAIGQAFADAAPHVNNFFNSFGDVSDQSFGNAEKTAKRLQKEYDKLDQKLQRRLKININPGSSRQFSDLFLPSEEELRADLKAIEDQFNESIARISQLRKPPPIFTKGSAAEAAPGQTAAQKKAVESLTSSLKYQSETYGKTREQIIQYKLNLNDATAAQRAATQSYSDSVSAHEFETEAIKQLNAAIEEEQQQKKASSEKMMEHTRATEEYRQSIIGIIDPLAQFRKQMMELDLAKESFPELTQQIEDAQQALEQGLNKTLEETDQIASDLGFAFESAFESAIIEGGKLSDVLQGLADDMLRLITRELVTKPMASKIESLIPVVVEWFATSGSATSGGSTVSARALGGPVAAGAPYLVGERGPELMVPRQSGMIIPNNKLGGGGVSVVNNFTVNSSGGGSFQPSQQQIAEAVYRGTVRASKRLG